MVADRIPNPRHEGSIPSIGAFRYSRISARTIDNWTFIAFLPAPCGAGRGPVVGQRPGHLIWVEGIGGSSPSNWTRRPQDAQLPAEWAPQPGRRLHPGEALDCRCRPTHAPCAGNPQDIRRRAGERPWLNRTERLPTKQEGAGSNPAGRAVSEAEADEAPGRDPGGSGFEPRRTP